MSFATWLVRRRSAYRLTFVLHIFPFAFLPSIFRHVINLTLISFGWMPTETIASNRTDSDNTLSWIVIHYYFCHCFFTLTLDAFSKLTQFTWEITWKRGHEIMYVLIWYILWKESQSSKPVWCIPLFILWLHAETYVHRTYQIVERHEIVVVVTKMNDIQVRVNFKSK